MKGVGFRQPFNPRQSLPKPSRAVGVLTIFLEIPKEIAQPRDSTPSPTTYFTYLRIHRTENNPGNRIRAR